MPVLKRCPQCGLHHDITVNCCSCGNNLTAVFPERMDMPPAAQLGSVDLKVPVYVQNCTFCGTDNFTDSPAHKLPRCRNCRKPRIAKLEPVLWDENAPKEPPKAEPVPEAKPEVTPEVKPDPAPVTTDWGTALNQLLGGAGAVPAATPAATKTPEPVLPKNMRLVVFGSRKGFDETFRPEDSPVLIGRYAGDILKDGDPRRNQYQRIESFFGSDSRVSSYHCQFVYLDGRWKVVDGSFGLGPALPEKASKNHTYVNGSQTPEAVLSAGNVVRLGGQTDSITIRVEFV